jgi:hypothetical protein
MRQRPTGIFTYLTNLQSMHTRILPQMQRISPPDVRFRTDVVEAGGPTSNAPTVLSKQESTSDAAPDG